MMKSITFENWLEKRKEKVRPTSKRTYQSYVRKHLLPYFKSILLEKITQKMIRSFKKYLKKKKRLSAKTTRDILSHLGKILKDAEQAGYNTCTKVPRVKIKEAEHTILGLRAQMKISVKLKESQDSKNMAVWLALNSGLRLGEVLGLCQGDIDLEAGVLHVRKNLQRVPLENCKGTTLKRVPPKTKKSRRDIPLNNRMKSVLETYMQMLKTDDNAPLFSSKTGKALNPRTLQQHFSRLKEKYQLDPNLTFHSLRHSFATRAMEKGVEPRALSEILGHSTVSFTLQSYGNCVNEHKRRQMEKLADLA